jgi:hypothetical protein
VVGWGALAYAPVEVQQHVLEHLGRITPYTITQPGILRRQLSRRARSIGRLLPD